MKTPQTTHQKAPSGLISSLALADAWHIPQGTLTRLLARAGIPGESHTITFTRNGVCHTLRRRYYPIHLHPHHRKNEPENA